jgi:hypothetical protein
MLSKGIMKAEELLGIYGLEGIEKRLWEMANAAVSHEAFCFADENMDYLSIYKDIVLMFKEFQQSKTNK